MDAIVADACRLSVARLLKDLKSRGVDTRGWTEWTAVRSELVGMLVNLQVADLSPRELLD